MSETKQSMDRLVPVLSSQDPEYLSKVLSLPELFRQFRDEYHYPLAGFMSALGKDWFRQKVDLANWAALDKRRQHPPQAPAAPDDTAPCTHCNGERVVADGNGSKECPSCGGSGLCKDQESFEGEAFD